MLPYDMLYRIIEQALECIKFPGQSVEIRGGWPLPARTYDSSRKDPITFIADCIQGVE